MYQSALKAASVGRYVYVVANFSTGRIRITYNATKRFVLQTAVHCKDIHGRASQNSKKK